MRITLLLFLMWAPLANAAEPVIFDTDIGTDIDDAYALVALIQRPELELLGVTTVSSDAMARAPNAIPEPSLLSLIGAGAVAGIIAYRIKNKK